MSRRKVGARRVSASAATKSPESRSATSSKPEMSTRLTMIPARQPTARRAKPSLRVDVRVGRAVRSRLTPSLKDTIVYVRPPSLFRQEICSLERWRHHAFHRTRSPAAPCRACRRAWCGSRGTLNHGSEAPEGAGSPPANYGKKHCRASARHCEAGRPVGTEPLGWINKLRRDLPLGLVGKHKGWPVRADRTPPGAGLGRSSSFRATADRLGWVVPEVAVCRQEIGVGTKVAFNDRQ